MKIMERWTESDWARVEEIAQDVKQGKMCERCGKDLSGPAPGTPRLCSNCGGVKNLDTFTPRLRNGYRIAMRLSPEDNRKTLRKGRWSATVRDLNTGKRYRVKGASCGLPECYCDAIAHPVK